MALTGVRAVRFAALPSEANELRRLSDTSTSAVIHAHFLPRRMTRASAT